MEREKKQNPKEIKGVNCTVGNCRYNENGCRCTAGEVRVGPHHACTSADTVCSTFVASKEQ